MSNSLKTSRSCQKLLLSGKPLSILPATGGPSIQAEFEEPTVYTVEFRVSNVQNVNTPAGNIPQPPPLVASVTPTATIQWSLGGNTIYRKISVFSGASISGVCEQLVASVSDETILPTTFQVGIPIVIGGKTVLAVNTVATANVPAQNGLAQVINGVDLDTDGMTVLLKAQVAPSTSGVWVVHAGVWGRLAPLAVGVHASGAYMLIGQGTHAGQWYALPAVSTDVVGVDGLLFVPTNDPTFQLQYSVTIVGGEGTRPATALPPTYQNYLFSNSDQKYRYGAIIISASGTDHIDIPTDIGITSVMITVASNDSTVTTGQSITPDNFLVVTSDIATNTLKSYFPLDYTFVPLSSQASRIDFFNLSTTFDMLVSVTWGIDG